MSYSACQASDRFHFLALPQGCFGTLALIHFQTQTAVAQGQGAGVEGHDRQHQGRHDDQQSGAAIASGAGAKRLGALTKIDRAQGDAVLHDRSTYRNDRVAVVSGLGMGQLRGHGFRPITGDHDALVIINSDSLDIRIGLEGGNIFADRLGVTEGQGRRHGIGQNARLNIGRLCQLGLVARLGIDGQTDTGADQGHQADHHHQQAAMLDDMSPPQHHGRIPPFTDKARLSSLELIGRWLSVAAR